MILIVSSTVLTVVGLTAEFVGVVLLGRQFLQMTLREMLSSVLSAFLSKSSREAMAASAIYGGERHTENARGLSFVCVGLLLQISGACVDFAARVELHQSALGHHQEVKPETAKEPSPIKKAPEQSEAIKQ
jgi:hypothetical protein